MNIRWWPSWAQVIKFIVLMYHLIELFSRFSFSFQFWYIWSFCSHNDFSHVLATRELHVWKGVSIPALALNLHKKPQSNLDKLQKNLLIHFNWTTCSVQSTWPICFIVIGSGLEKSFQDKEFNRENSREIKKQVF